MHKVNEEKAPKYKHIYVLRKKREINKKRVVEDTAYLL